MSQSGIAGIVLILMIFILIAIPCTLISLLGYKMLNKLAYHPSKTPGIQLSIFWQLIVIEGFSVILLLLFYLAFSQSGAEGGLTL